MHTRKWLSNLQKVLQKILEVDRAVKVDFYMRNLPSEKTLDILWLATEDFFTYRVNRSEEEYPLTKRNFLRKIATLFDPMGSIAPYVIRAKIPLQDMCTTGLD